MSCNAAKPNFHLRHPGDSRTVWIIPVFQLLTEQNNVIRPWPQFGSAPRLAIQAEAGSPLEDKPSRSRLGGGESLPTNVRATAGPRKVLSGHGDCGGAPIGIHGRELSCRPAPSGRKTPGARTLTAATTTGRYGSTAITMAIGSSATTTCTISLSRSITTPRHASPAAAARYSCIWRAKIFLQPPGVFR